MSGNARRPPKERRRPAMTPERLRNIAVYYCQRYVVSGGKLADYLERRLRREMTEAEDRAAMAERIPEIVESLSRTGLVNDGEAASAKLRGAIRAGYAKDAAVGMASRGAMVEREAVAGALDRAMADTVPEIAEAEMDRTEEAAAMADAALRRARRGPYRTRGADEKTQRRDADWLRRRGFRYDAVRRAMRLDGEEFGGEGEADA